jgi:RHS repeat-associated protein
VASYGRGKFGESRSLNGVPEVGSGGEANLFLQDVTGDGLADVVYVDTSHADVYPQNGTATLAPKKTVSTPYRNLTVSAVRLADMNGNGSADIVVLTPSAAPDERVQYVEVVGDVRPNLLATVQNGMGKTVTFVYANTGQEFQDAADNGKPWTQGLPFAMQVLKGTQVSDGLGHEYVTEYTYRDGFFSPTTREFRGFAQATMRALGDEASPTSLETTWFDLGETQEALKGVVLKTESSDESGKVYRRTESLFEARRFAVGLSGVEVRQALTVSTKLSLLEDAVPVTREDTVEYDGFANVTKATSNAYRIGGQIQRGQEDGVTENTYANNEAKWLLKFPVTSRVRSAAGTVYSETRSYYDGEAFVGLPLGQVEKGFVTRTESWVEGTRYIQSSRVKRDEFGNVTATRSPLGLERSIGFDATHTFAEKESLPSPNGVTLEWTSKHDNGTGMVLWAQEPNGVKTQALYDSLGRAVAIVKPGNTVAEPTVRFVYALGAPQSSITSLTRFSKGLESLNVSVFDGLGRKLRTAQRVGERFLVSGLQEYTRKGLVATQWHGFWSDTALGLPPAETGQERNFYDVQERLARRLRADGKLEKTVYGSISSNVFNADEVDRGEAAIAKTVVVNALGNAVDVVERVRGKPDAVSQLDIDALGRVTIARDAERIERAYSYDGLSRLTRLIDVDAGKREYAYDDGSNRVSTKSGFGEEKTVFDLLERPTESLAFGKTGELESKTVFHYDGSPPQADFDSKNYVGRLSWVEDDGGQEFSQYDERGRLAAMRRVIDAKSYDMRTKYDDADRVVSLTYPDGFELPVSVDEAGRTVGLGGLLSAVEFNGRAEVTRIELTNGVSETRAYDGVGRLAASTLKSAGTTLKNSSYRYDGRGNVTEVVDTVSKQLNAQYVYDDISRLTSAKIGERVFSYAYSPSGNLTAIDGEAVAYGARAHAPISRGGSTLEYGEAGELKKWSGVEGAYDAFGKLRRVAGPKGDTKYTYSASRELLKQEGPEGTFLFPNKYVEVTPQGEWYSAYFGAQRLAKFQVDGKKAGCSAAPDSGFWLFVWLAGLGLFSRKNRSAVVLCGALALACPKPAPQAAFDNVRFFHLDNVGNVQLTTDKLGTPSGIIPYGPYGEALAETKEIHGFYGKYADTTSGLSFWNVRLLNSKVGRWTTPDVHALENVEAHFLSPQSLNVYAYARNNPLRFEDVQGGVEGERQPTDKVSEAGASTNTASVAQAFAQGIMERVRSLSPVAIVQGLIGPVFDIASMPREARMDAVIEWQKAQSIGLLMPIVPVAQQAAGAAQKASAGDSQGAMRDFARVGFDAAMILAPAFAKGGLSTGGGAAEASTTKSGLMARVGRWMSEAELAQMTKSGKVQESFSGTTHLASPANAAAFARQAKAGSVYVEFDVPAAAVKKTSEGWGKIPGPNSLEGRAALRRGSVPPEMPACANIEVCGRK